MLVLVILDKTPSIMIGKTRLKNMRYIPFIVQIMHTNYKILRLLK